MQFTYDLFEIEKPVYGGLIFTDAVVRQAITDCENCSQFHPRQGIMELCRFEEPDPNDNDRFVDNQMARLAASGKLLETIGFVDKLWIENGVLKCSGRSQENLHWPRPVEDYTPIPYMELNSCHIVDPITRRSIGLRNVSCFRFTEVVLAYQGVTRLAVRKFHERKINKRR